MASTGGTRKTSNGCQAAKSVPRKDNGFRVPSGNIAAIDFGTTNCSLAYITASDSFEEGPKRLPLNTTYYRVPTAILFTPDGSVNSFGYVARELYLNLDDTERLTYAYFEQIKMGLQHDETVSREMKIKASNGTEYFLVDVIGQILKYLKNELIENHLKRGGVPLEATDFDWVITVPAIWEARGKQMMREAGYKAGLCSEVDCGNLQPASQASQTQPSESSPDKLTLALEPESAAIFCQNMSQQSAAPFCKTAKSYKASSFLVVDIGGGTVDISAHHKGSSAGSMEVVHPPKGNDCGGSRVNKEFRKFLGKLVKDTRFLRYLNTDNSAMNAKHNADLDYLMNDTFEKQKLIFGSQTSAVGKLSVRLPYTFMTTYSTEIQRGLQQYSQSEFQLSGMDLRISHAQMEEFLKPIANGLLSCMDRTLKDVERPPSGKGTKIEAIYLVGGFGGCHYIYRAVRERFGDNYTYIIPSDTNFAVVRGAVLYYRNPEFIQSRRVDATYGIRTNITFNSAIHDDEYKWVDDDGVSNCKYIFSTIVECGDAVSPEMIYTTEFVPASRGQKRMAFDIYSSPETDVWYTTGKREKGSSQSKPATVRKVGEFEVEMPVLTGDKSRTVDVTFDFSHTEIQVKGYDRTSGNEVKVVLDFLSA